MAEPNELDLRHREASRWLAWLSRTVLACLFAIGMLGTASRPLVEAEVEPESTVELGEVGEVLAREHALARLGRRTSSHGRSWWARRLAWAQAPGQVDPTVASPTPPRWQRPRRAPPPSDDDGPSIG